MSETENPRPDTSTLPWETQVRLLVTIRFAVLAHGKQVYRGYGGQPDLPYIIHPLEVAEMVSERARVVAVLHDVLEDTDAELPTWVTGVEFEALVILTRDKDQETYQEYIRRVCAAEGEAGDIAREVKSADLAVNLSHDPPPHLWNRYMAARETFAAHGITPPVRSEVGA